MSNATKWIRLNYDRIAPETHPDDAVWVSESASPYDVPSDVRAAYDPTTGHVVIDFRYITDEPTETVDLGAYGQALVGRNSRRVLSLRFDTHSYIRARNAMAHGRGQDMLSIAAQESLASIPAKFARNRELVGKAISDKARALFDSSQGSVLSPA